MNGGVDFFFTKLYNLAMKEIFPGITADPAVQFGKPVIAGTRVPVDLIVGHLAAGDSIEQVMKEYQLEQADVRAALKYASKIVGEETLIFGNAFSH